MTITHVMVICGFFGLNVVLTQICQVGPNVEQRGDGTFFLACSCLCLAAVYCDCAFVT